MGLSPESPRRRGHLPPSGPQGSTLGLRLPLGMDSWFPQVRAPVRKRWGPCIPQTGLCPGEEKRAQGVLRGRGWPGPATIPHWGSPAWVPGDGGPGTALALAWASEVFRPAAMSETSVHPCVCVGTRVSGHVVCVGSARVPPGLARLSSWQQWRHTAVRWPWAGVRAPTTCGRLGGLLGPSPPPAPGNRGDPVLPGPASLNRSSSPPRAPVDL